MDGPVQVAVRCAVRCINAEGLSDGRSMATLLAQMAPFKTVLVRGDAESTAHLAAEVRRSAGRAGEPAWVRTPLPLERLDATSDSNVYKVRAWTLEP